ncbi:hypothetical protein SUGI_0356570 [Cryptomeria japonica]|uniref:disease resistance RPP13-like protein 4 n=1 Tax=Cryptomeria japonica TaxID=3369 RepID=UPI002408A1E9|nr:disease resistance RPP13-like protein 4 [Cryptomeria japonica]GLJ19683.1 hypothetical protein SUGI_0356570 [Cryptomeria japonica]
MEAGLALAIANGVLGKLGQIATEQALNEASLLLNFKSDFKWLEKKLRHISVSLQVADEQSEQNKDVKEWLAEVRNIVFDAEDIIDECGVEYLYTNTSQSCVSNCSQLLFRYKMGKRIKDIKERIRSAIQDAQELKLFREVAHLSQPSTSTSQSERRTESKRGIILDKATPAVAVEHKVDEILRLLENPAFRVVAVVGMGGLGKTFLVQHVFNRSKHRYECYARISVSQTYSLRKLQCDLAFQMNFQIDSSISDWLAAEFIHGKLDGRRCLIVLDDVWRTSVEGNLISRLGLPTGSNSQCIIVVTTRSRDVAQNLNAHIYEMPHLSEDDSWNLFCQFAFRDREGNRPPEQLERLAHQIVQECGRLPLALRTVAASMARSSLTSDWDAKLGQLKKVGTGEDSVMKILKLSYDSLPPYLKSCFAYFSFFPEDTHIFYCTFPIEGAIYYEDYVIYLWIAEGFIPQEKDREQWDTGLDYLNQLVNLCLLEVDRVKGCYTVHDLLLDLVVNICKEHECEFDLPSKETSCRRLLVAKKDITTNEISERRLKCQRFLRTLSFSHIPGITSIPQQLLDHVRVLRVIDFSRTAISTLPKCVGNLKLMRVLNLSYTQIRELPACVRRLKSLQFLDVSFCKSLQSLPHWIGELSRLSHLNLERCSDWGTLTLAYMPKGISQFLSLRTLKSDCFILSTEENEFLSVKDVGNLTNLQEISFSLKDVSGLTSLEDGIFDHLVKMRILRVANIIPATESDREESSLPAFPEKMNVMKDLQQLYLSRFSVPSWICGMENLTDLFLDECCDYSSLQKMPRLRLLCLRNDSKCRELPKEFGESGGFPKLVKLQIEDFPLLEELPALEEGAMPRLEGLGIMNCPLVKRVPEGLEQIEDFPLLEELPALEEGAMPRLEGLGIMNCPLVKRVPEGLERWHWLSRGKFVPSG